MQNSKGTCPATVGPPQIETACAELSTACALAFKSINELSSHAAACMQWVKRALPKRLVVLLESLGRHAQLTRASHVTRTYSVVTCPSDAHICL